MSNSSHAKVLIVGSGTAGVSVAASLIRKDSSLKNNITIVDPSEDHYYQPFFTLVGAGDSKLEDNVRSQESLMPEGVRFVKDAVTSFNPDENLVDTQSGTILSYDYLVVTAGIQLDFNKIEGLEETMGKNGVCSNYSANTVESTWEAMQNVKDGRAIFTQPSTPIKCAGAPQKIMYLADENFRNSGVRSNVTMEFASGMPALFPVKHYYPVLKELIKDKGIEESFNMDLIKVDGKKQEATFKNSESGETIVREFSMLHVTPPMSPPTFIKESTIVDEDGWVSVDMHTLRHTEYNNIFSAGDCSNLPTAKTGAGIRKQVPVLVENLLATMRNKPLTGSYDGYASCPLVVSYDKVILAEFVYGFKAQETFPFDQRVPRKSMFFMKKNILPMMYWNGMLKGTM